MPRKSCNKPSYNEDHENKRIIEKWMMRNSSNKLIIGQDKKSDYLQSPPKNSSKCDIKVSEKKKVVIPIGITEKPLNKLKRAHSFSTNSDTNNASKAKIVRQSLQPTGTSVTTVTTNVSINSIQTSKLVNKTKPSIEIIPTKHVSKFPQKSPNETVPIIEVIRTTNNITGKQINHQQKSNTSMQIITHNVEKFIYTEKGKNVSSTTKSNAKEISPTAKQCNQIVKPLSSPTVKCNVIRTPKTKVNVTNSETNTCTPTNIGGINSEENNLLKDKDKVYKCLLDNYRYLVIPKEWSVNELINEKKNRYIVFFNNQVIEDKGVLISVIKKSLVIDKGGTLNYSVHGLPIDIKQTILPKTLDNIKKLLSILHIFDKMQVCEGVSSDLKEVQNNIIFKDCYRYWRHKNCKIILVKATRCSECTDAQNLLQKKSATNTVKQEIEFVNVPVKNEDLLGIN